VIGCMKRELLRLDVNYLSSQFHDASTPSALSAGLAATHQTVASVDLNVLQCLRRPSVWFLSSIEDHLSCSFTSIMLIKERLQVCYWQPSMGQQLLHSQSEKSLSHYACWKIKDVCFVSFQHFNCFKGYLLKPHEHWPHLKQAPSCHRCKLTCL
jgi:hypothetical protein